jgi:hypothetical protein
MDHAVLLLGFATNGARLVDVYLRRLARF